MSKHTPGRLSVDEYPVTLANGDLAHAKLSIVAPSKDPRYPHFSIGMVNFSAELTGLFSSDVKEAEANARRLVACWNACVGMETDALEQISRTGWIAGGKAIAKAEAILAAPQPSADAVEAAFREGFRSPTTYNDTVMNSEDDAWENSEARAEAAKAAPQPADDGWIPWGGGACPVEVGTRVDVRYRDGWEGDGLAFMWRWHHATQKSSDVKELDIVAYRVVKP